MKFKFTFLLSVFLLFGSVNAQVVLSQDFTNYDGTSATVPAGWYFSYNGYYITGGNFGVAAPSYKFGVDAATIITPAFSLADSLSFWYKSQGVTVSDSNRLDIYESPDSVNWTPVASMDTLGKAAHDTSFSLLPTSTHLKFIFVKVTGNLAFDDLVIYGGLGTGIKSNLKKESLSVYPNPSTGLFNIDLGKQPGKVEVLNLLGKIILQKECSENFVLDLSKFAAGNYFIKISSKEGVQTKKITVLH